MNHLVLIIIYFYLVDGGSIVPQMSLSTANTTRRRKVMAFDG
jgi:hypothetical protein